MKVRKKPIEVEAVQWTIGTGFAESAEWITEAISNGDLYMWNMSDDKVYWLVRTLEGAMMIGDKDWLIRGVNGELYPCKDDIFRKTYDIVSSRLTFNSNAKNLEPKEFFDLFTASETSARVITTPFIGLLLTGEKDGVTYETFLHQSSLKEAGFM